MTKIQQRRLTKSRQHCAMRAYKKAGQNLTNMQYRSIEDRESFLVEFNSLCLSGSWRIKNENI